MMARLRCAWTTQSLLRRGSKAVLVEQPTLFRVLKRWNLVEGGDGCERGTKAILVLELISRRARGWHEGIEPHTALRRQVGVADAFSTVAFTERCSKPEDVAFIIYSHGENEASLGSGPLRSWPTLLVVPSLYIIARSTMSVPGYLCAYAVPSHERQMETGTARGQVTSVSPSHMGICRQNHPSHINSPSPPPPRPLPPPPSSTTAPPSSSTAPESETACLRHHPSRSPWLQPPARPSHSPSPQ